MALFGDIGKFFTSGPGIVFTPISLPLIGLEAVRHGQSPITAITGAYQHAIGAGAAHPGVTHSETMIRSLETPVIAGAIGGTLSGSVPLADVTTPEFGFSPDFYGGAAWPTESTPSPGSLPSREIIQQVSVYSPPAATPGLLQTVGPFLPTLAEFLA